MKKISIAAVTLGLLAFTSCQNSGQAEKEDRTSDSSVAENKEQAEVAIRPTEPGPEFPGATLTIKDITGKPIEGNDSVEVTINYNVKNYELKAQTSDVNDRTCNNSKDGQHIHFILDNGPYAALYEPKHTFKVAKNSEHTLLSFLSRSYHLSLKNKEAFALIKFSVDGNGKVSNMPVKNEPMLFYSRPKGDYLGKDTKDVLLDFYVVNTTLDANGHKVIATINGKTFTIDKWQPYIVNNLPMGANTIQLQLADKNGNPVSGAFTSVSREFKLSQDEPMTARR